MAIVTRGAESRTGSDPVEAARAKLDAQQSQGKPPVEGIEGKPPVEGKPGEQAQEASTPKYKLNEPLSIEQILALTKSPLPSKGAMEEIKKTEGPDKKRLEELQKTVEEGKVDYSKVKFINEDVFNDITSDPGKMNTFLQQFANYIGGDVAERIAFAQRSNQKYAEDASSKMMSDLTTSQLIRDFLGQENNNHLLPFQEYFVDVLVRNKEKDNGVHDLHQLLRLTAEEVAAKTGTKVTENQQRQVPPFGGLGTAFTDSANEKSGDDWSALMKELTGNK